eukprot:gene22276-27239_t
MDWLEPSETLQEDLGGHDASAQVVKSGMSFERMNEIELNLTLKLLSATDNKLYDPSLCNADDSTNMAIQDDEKIPRYYSEGYEANYEGVTDQEIRKWQKHFPYLMVEGHSIKDVGSEESRREVTSVETSSVVVEHFFENSGVDANAVDLVILGRSMRIHPLYLDSNIVPTGSGEEEYEEIIEQEGILEDILVIDVDPSHEVDVNLEENELLADVKKAIWSNVIDRLRPFVKQVLQYADEHDVSSNMEELNAKSCATFDDNDDDGW